MKLLCDRMFFCFKFYPNSQRSRKNSWNRSSDTTLLIQALVRLLTRKRSALVPVGVQRGLHQPSKAPVAQRSVAKPDFREFKIFQCRFFLLLIFFKAYVRNTTELTSEDLNFHARLGFGIVWTELSCIFSWKIISWGSNDNRSTEDICPLSLWLSFEVNRLFIYSSINFICENTLFSPWGWHAQLTFSYHVEKYRPQ